MSFAAWHILVVDDEPNVRKLLAGVLEDEGYTVSLAGDTGEATDILSSGGVNMMLLDVKLPDVDGLSFLRRLREEEYSVPVVMMSGHGSIQTAIEAIRLGALDFIEKPIKAERLLVSIANGLKLQKLNRENERMRQIPGTTDEIIGQSPCIERLKKEIARVAPTEAWVLITGENGTGKELVARTLHSASRRRNQSFIKVNCAAIPSELLESELFGHERGAFTGAVSARRGKFEMAQRGTLLLDEVGDMNQTTQAKLLRVLEEREIERVGGERTIHLDVRVFASTNQELLRLIEKGKFREDLYHRLKVVPIHVPPLRERVGDVTLLAERFLSQFCYGRMKKSLTPEAFSMLESYRWPGNVRELRNFMERLVIMTDGTEVKTTDVSPLVADESRPARAADLFPEIPTLAGKLEACERSVIGKTLEHANGNIAEAGRRLGLDRANLHRRIKRLGLRE